MGDMSGMKSCSVSVAQEILYAIQTLWSAIEEGKRNDAFSKALLAQKIHEALTKRELAPFSARWVEEVRDRFYAKYVRDWKEDEKPAVG